MGLAMEKPPRMVCLLFKLWNGKKLCVPISVLQNYLSDPLVHVEILIAIYLFFTKLVSFPLMTEEKNI